MPKPPVPLRLAHAFDCGPIRVELAYTPVTVPDHVSGRTDEDPFRDRFEIRLVNRGLAAGAAFEYQTPQPLQFFFSVLRVRKDGSLVDLTVPQIDAHHTGRPQLRSRSFTRGGEALIDRISFFALATIVPDAQIVPGDYVVRISGFEILRVGSDVYGFEPVALPLTIVDPGP